MRKTQQRSSPSCENRDNARDCGRNPQSETTVDADGCSASTSFEFDGSELIRTLKIGDLEAKSAVTVERPSGDNLGDWWLQYLKGCSPRSLSPVSRELRFAELFCGSGGLALGAAQACAELGIQPRSVAAVDHDPEAVGVYAANHYPDITSTDSVSVLVDYRVKGPVNLRRSGTSQNFSNLPGPSSSARLMCCSLDRPAKGTQT